MSSKTPARANDQPSMARGSMSPGSISDSPGLADPRLDPAGPGVAPHKPRPDPEAKENAYSPDFKSRPEPKPHHDADIDTPSG